MKIKVIFLLAALIVMPMVGCTKPEEPVVPTQDTVVKPEIALCDSVFFYEQCLYRPGDYGSMNYRIPAICTLPDGTLLAVNDKRKYNEGDLPQDIDIVCRRSTDNGRTWSEPSNIIVGTGYKHGYGDPALVVCPNGDVLCVFCGLNGFWQSTEADPQGIFVCRSTDGGVSWSQAEDIHTAVWGSQAVNSACRNYKGGFIASGNGLVLKRGEHKGRIIFVAALCRKSANIADNYAVYSDDNGHIWQVSDLAFSRGDEAKVVELVDGRVLMSVRQSGPRGYNISEDGGATWGAQNVWPEMSTNACNGELLRLCSVDGAQFGEPSGERNILIHSIPNSMDRENVSIFVSYDEGRTWQDPVTLCAGPSVYSSLTLQRDGTIGAYIEKNPNGACELWYQNFTYAWLLEQLIIDN